MLGRCLSGDNFALAGRSYGRHGRLRTKCWIENDVREGKALRAMADFASMLGRMPSGQSSEGALWVIDVGGAKLLRSNLAGLALLGLPPTTSLPRPFDRSMPALALLARTRAGQSNYDNVTLLFWTMTRPLLVNCHVRATTLQPYGLVCEVRAAAPRTSDAPSPGRDPLFMPESGRMPAIASADKSGGTRAAAFGTTGRAPSEPAIDSAEQADVIPSAPPATNDLATLQEIARRIRQGQSQSPFGLLPDAPDEDGTVATAPSAETPSQTFAPASGTAASAHARPELDQSPPLPTVAAMSPAAAAPTDAEPSEALRTASHEIRTPLAAIAALAEVIRDEHFGPVGDERYRTYARDIADSARHALAVIDATLGATGTWADGDYVFTEVDVDLLIAQCRATVKPLADMAGITLETAVPAGSPRIIADIRSLKQILLNLLSNAIKFTPPQGRVGLSAERRPGGAFCLLVTDTGQGMTNAEIAQIGNGLGRTATGSGMGLAIATRLARRNGAILNLTATPSKGLVAQLTFSSDRLVLI